MKRPIVIDARELPEAPLEAAKAFAERQLRVAREAGAGDIVVLFAPADHAHAGWRRAMVEELAREAAPARVNAVVANGEDAAREVIDYLARAPGVTGQVLEVAGTSA